MTSSLRRRDVITRMATPVIFRIGWPIAARAQQPALPVIGFLAVGPNGPKRWGADFHQGLKEAGYVEGHNVAIEYLGGPPRINRLSELADELVHQQVAVILTSNDGPALAAKLATSTIPIVFFNIGSDPVTLGLVASINRPGANVTGAVFDSPQLAAKRLDLLCQLVPTAATVAHLTRSRTLLSFEEHKNVLVETAGALGRQLITVECRSDNALKQSFESIIERGAGAVIVGPLFTHEVAFFAADYKIPAIYNGRGFVLGGGLMSYGHDFAEQIRLAVGLVGQILNGAKPADLPIRRSHHFDFVINLKTAKQLGIEVPQRLLVFANEIIE